MSDTFEYSCFVDYEINSYFYGRLEKQQVKSLTTQNNIKIERKYINGTLTYGDVFERLSINDIIKRINNENKTNNMLVSSVTIDNFYEKCTVYFKVNGFYTGTVQLYDNIDDINAIDKLEYFVKYKIDNHL